MHRHAHEDDYSDVLEGRIGAIFDRAEVYATVGDFVRKPRREWHTFWNAGDGPLRILEIITPVGPEELFRLMGVSDAPTRGLPNPLAPGEGEVRRPSGRLTAGGST